MTDPLVPGCSVDHRRWVYLVSAAAVAVLLAAALIWPHWWLTVAVAVAAYVAAYHPLCRRLNHRSDKRNC